MSLSVDDVDFGDQNIIYITPADKDKIYGVEWTKPATENLLKFVKKYLRLFEIGNLRTKKQVYENVSAALDEMGMFYSSAQCENKWKSLKRSYMTRYEKGNTAPRRLPFTKPPYESQIEEIMKMEKPAFKKEIEMFNTINLNIPPGYTKIEPETSSENEDEQIQMYTEQDEELVQRVLREPKSEDSDSKDESMSKCMDFEDHTQSVNEHSYSCSNNLEKHECSSLVEELTELKKIIKKNLATNTEVLRNHNATHEQIMTYLDTLEKREEEKLELKRRKLEKQDEFIQQLKIQNSLIAKLIQKLGNK